MTLKRDRTATIIAVGTELTEGQIINRNAAWLSQHLAYLGFTIRSHKAVADDRALILEALAEAEGHSGLLFVTGGLGPTSDDFTRNVIAEWAGVALQLDPPTWEKVEKKLISRGARVLDVHRQQAYFPQGARILENSVGTAEGFYCSRQSEKGLTQLWALPGPPKEIESIWSNAIEATLRDWIPVNERQRLFTWQCIGKGESEIAAIVDKVLQGSGLKVGYRLNSPYVEVKVWCLEQAVASHQKWFDGLDEALKSWLIVKNNEDLARLFIEQLSPNTWILDAATDGLLVERLNPLLRQFDETNEKNPSILTQFRMSSPDPRQWVQTQLVHHPENTLAVAGFADDGRWAAGYKREGRIQVKEWPPVVRRSWWTERGRRVVCELVLQYWTQELR